MTTRDPDVLGPLIPSPEAARALEVQTVVGVHWELAQVAGDFADAGVREALERARSLLEVRGAGANRRLNEVVGPKQAVVLLDRIDEEVDQLWQYVRGRTREERLLTCYLVSGFCDDAVAWIDELHDEVAPVTDPGAPARDALREGIERLFAIDPSQRGRLAMWGRRIAGDCVVWVRMLLGVAPGRSGDEIAFGGERALERLGARLFANHSRRMSALRLAA